MNDRVLPGLRTTPLGGYLGALGLLRAVTRLLDGEAQGYWQRQRFVLSSRYRTVDELVTALRERYEPEPIVSPWNAGSGFAGNGKNSTAEGLLRWVRESGDPRLTELRAAVHAGDRVVAMARERFADSSADLWGGGADTKLDVLALCRQEFPDAALAWVDAAVALRDQDGPAYSRLLGTGGNFGRQDVSVTYLAQLRVALTDDRSGAWLDALCSGDESVSYLRGTVGQFDPGRAGGIQSSVLEKADDSGFVNPWSVLLTVEGVLLFATAVVRRHGAERRDAALPFQVRGSTSGHASAAPGEVALGELWAPEWSAPARVREIEHLLGEGRAQWRGRAARTGLDFVRAIASLGVDRGIDGFQRHVFADRLGQNPLAVPAGRIEVTERAAVRLLTGLDDWLERLRRSTPPASVAALLRELEAQLFAHARGAQAALVDVFAALGRSHGAVERSGAMRAAVAPLLLRNGRRLLFELWSHTGEDRELRIALALATARDRCAGSVGLRPLLAPVTVSERGAVSWSNGGAPISLAAGIGRAVAEAARRRAFPGAVADPDTSSHPGADTDPPPAVRGVRIAFTGGLRLRGPDIDALAFGDVDEHRLRALLAGLLCVDWRGVGGYPLALAGERAADPVLDVLSLFTLDEPLSITDTDGYPKTIMLRPGSEWPALLLAGRTQAVLNDATRRLRISGLGEVTDVRAGGHAPEALAVALLLPVRRSDVPGIVGRLSTTPETHVRSPRIEDPATDLPPADEAEPDEQTEETFA